MTTVIQELIFVSSMGNELLKLQKDICVSLWMMPGDLDELCSREFLSNIADFNVDRLLMILEKKRWIYIDKKGKYHTYKATVEKELKEYGL